jgi:hypothetical protein
VIGHSAQAEEIFGFEEQEAVVAGEALPVLDFLPDGDQALVGEVQVLTSVWSTSGSCALVTGPRNDRSNYIQRRRRLSRFPWPPRGVDTRSPVC